MSAKCAIKNVSSLQIMSIGFRLGIAPSCSGLPLCRCGKTATLGTLLLPPSTASAIRTTARPPARSSLIAWLRLVLISRTEIGRGRLPLLLKMVVSLTEFITSLVIHVLLL